MMWLLAVSAAENAERDAEIDNTPGASIRARSFSLGEVDHVTSMPLCHW